MTSYPDISSLSISVKNGEQIDLSNLLDLYLKTPVKSKTEHNLISKILSQQEHKNSELINQKFVDFCKEKGGFNAAHVGVYRLILKMFCILVNNQWSDETGVPGTTTWNRRRD